MKKNMAGGVETLPAIFFYGRRWAGARLRVQWNEWLARCPAARKRVRAECRKRAAALAKVKGFDEE